MKTEYDVSTKDKEISCSEIVDDILYSKLGLKPANNGTRYLRELIMYIYKKETYEYRVDKEIQLFLKEKGIDKNYKTVKSTMVYAINNARKDKLKENFYYVFKTDYDTYFVSIKNIVNSVLTLIENYK